MWSPLSQIVVALRYVSGWWPLVFIGGYTTLSPQLNHEPSHLTSDRASCAMLFLVHTSTLALDYPMLLLEKHVP